MLGLSLKIRLQGGGDSDPIISRRILRNTNPILESQPWWNVDVKGYLKGGCQKNDPVSCALSSIFGPASKIKAKSKNDIWNRIWATNGTSVKKRLDCLNTFLGIQDVPGLRTMLQIDDFYGDLWNDPANHESINLSPESESFSLPSRNRSVEPSACGIAASFSRQNCFRPRDEGFFTALSELHLKTPRQFKGGDEPKDSPSPKRKPSILSSLGIDNEHGDVFWKKAN